MYGAMNVRFHEAARGETLAATDFYEKQAKGLGAAFISEVEESVDRMSDNPESGAPYTGNCRRILLRRFPFNVIYTVDDGGILIVAVAHQRRKPGYWSERL